MTAQGCFRMDLNLNLGNKDEDAASTSPGTAATMSSSSRWTYGDWTGYMKVGGGSYASRDAFFWQLVMRNLFSAALTSYFADATPGAVVVVNPLIPVHSSRVLCKELADIHPELDFRVGLGNRVC
jgi:hypothetical protein